MAGSSTQMVSREARRSAQQVRRVSCTGPEDNLEDNWALAKLFWNSLLLTTIKPTNKVPEIYFIV